MRIVQTYDLFEFAQKYISNKQCNSQLLQTQPTKDMAKMSLHSTGMAYVYDFIVVVAK